MVADNKTSFDLEDGEVSFSFFEGEIDFSAYSYYIDSYGSGSLNKDQTKELYKVMKNYYEG